MRRLILIGLPILFSMRCSGADPIQLFTDAGDAATKGDATTTDSPAGCSGGQSRCADVCVDTTSDPQNCGGCGVVCADKGVCVASACAACDTIDADKDGYNACVDCNDNDPNVNPGAFAVAGRAAD